MWTSISGFRACQLNPLHYETPTASPLVVSAVTGEYGGFTICQCGSEELYFWAFPCPMCPWLKWVTREAGGTHGGQPHSAVHTCLRLSSLPGDGSHIAAQILCQILHHWASVGESVSPDFCSTPYHHVRGSTVQVQSTFPDSNLF